MLGAGLNDLAVQCYAVRIPAPLGMLKLFEECSSCLARISWRLFLALHRDGLLAGLRNRRSSSGAVWAVCSVHCITLGLFKQWPVSLEANHQGICQAATLVGGHMHRGATAMSRLMTGGSTIEQEARPRSPAPLKLWIL